MNSLDVFQNRKRPEEETTFGDAVKTLSRTQTQEGLVEIVGQYLSEQKWNQPVIVSVGSSKGGVGKSAIALNLSHSLASCGLKVGYVDLDFNDPNSISRTRNDISPREDGRIVFDRSLVDVVVGMKKSVKDDGKRKYHRERMNLRDVSYRSRRRINLNYFLTLGLGKTLEGRGSETERNKLLNEAHNFILDETRRTEGYHIFVLDFPPGMSEYLDAYFDSDERIFVVDGGDDASYEGIENVSGLLDRKLARKKELGNLGKKGSNIIVVNKIPPDFIEKMKNNPFFGRLPLKFLENWLGETTGRETARKYRETLTKRLSSLDFDRVVNVLYHRKIREPDDKHLSVPYLATPRWHGDLHAREMFGLSTYIIEDTLRSLK